MRFEWDDKKALENLSKHGVSFGEATEVFYDPNAVEIERNTKDKESKSRSDEVELIVTQEDYQAGLERGWTADDMLKPGRYKFKRGGFLARHPELKVPEKKRA